MSESSCSRRPWKPEPIEFSDEYIEEYNNALELAEKRCEEAEAAHCRTLLARLRMPEDELIMKTNPRSDDMLRRAKIIDGMFIYDPEKRKQQEIIDQKNASRSINKMKPRKQLKMRPEERGSTWARRNEERDRRLRRRNAPIPSTTTPPDPEVEGQRGRQQGSNGPRRVAALVAKYSWGQEGGPPPASEAELQSLADQMARLRRERANFARPKRTDAERLARAETMLRIMRGKARAGFGGERAMATQEWSLNRSAGLALAKRARKLWMNLKTHLDSLGTPSVLIEEGIALLDAD